MKTFKDAAGRNWTIALNLGTAMRVADATGIDLLRPEEGDPPAITRIGTDEMLLGKVLCALLEDQFEAHKVNDEQVVAAFDGRTLLDAQTAFYEELSDFFQSRGRTDRMKAIRAQKAMVEKGVAAAEAEIAGLNLDAMVKEAMDEARREAAAARGSSSGSSPASSQSTPAR